VVIGIELNKNFKLPLSVILKCTRKIRRNLLSKGKQGSI
jgi:hypothetical protein